MPDLTHLTALQSGLATLKAISKPSPLQIVFIRQAEKEIQDEKRFLLLDEAPEFDCTDDELLAMLFD